MKHQHRTRLPYLRLYLVESTQGQSHQALPTGKSQVELKTFFPPMFQIVEPAPFNIEISLMNKASDLLTGGGAILAKASNADKGKLVKNQCRRVKRSKKGQNLPFSFFKHVKAMINNLLLLHPQS
ncbi:hypothetical protein F2K61_16290 [Vibrio parahaemolyticus]|nr:hypothetical protein [Vibrio parahaemolyticus]EGQ9449297.1 hypothetical protein [Vibrio parahaemolyticus]EGQ9535491.1 hypothetical protein [Vibrio parahaemolyticus]